MHDEVKKSARRSQAERSAVTSAKLIAATITTLYEKGYAATSTTRVAELAGVSRGAMLHHFPTKIHLMAATVYATYESDIAAYQTTIQSVRDQKERLDQLIDTAWACFKSPGGIAQTEVWMASRSDPMLADAVLPVHAKIVSQSMAGLKSVLPAKVASNTNIVGPMLTYLVGALRGLSLQHVIGAADEELQAGVDLIKSTIQTIVDAG
jgi:AcrR family transcriptional regulator